MHLLLEDVDLLRGFVGLHRRRAAAAAFLGAPRFAPAPRGGTAVDAVDEVAHLLFDPAGFDPVLAVVFLLLAPAPGGFVQGPFMESVSTSA